MIKPVITEAGGRGYVATWSGLVVGETCEPVAFVGASDRTVQVLGTFGAGGSVSIEGSLQPVPSTYATLTDPQGNALTFTSAKLESISELVSFVRPNITGGDGTTALTVHLLMRSTL